MEEDLNLYDKSNSILVVGVSRDNNKYGSKIFQTLLLEGYNVYGFGREKVHERVYTSLQELPDHYDLVIIVIPPSTQKDIIEWITKSKVKTVWFQPGSESPEYIGYLEQHGKRVIRNMCYIKDGLKISFRL
ncbi:MAG: CoA-binding protein [Candidatus Anstonellales archaeon]